MADTIMYATSPIMIEIIFFAFINSDLSVCKGTNFQRILLQKLCQRILLQKLCQTCFSYQRLTFLTASMYLFQYKRTKSRFDFAMNNPLKHVS